MAAFFFFFFFFYRILHYNIGGKFYDLLKNLYSKTKCAIKISNQRTEFFHYCKGAGQGCILSSMLFNLYLNEIAFIFLPNGSNLYANDLVLISHSAKGLEKALSILSEYCDKWLLSVNPKKTRVMS